MRSFTSTGAGTTRIRTGDVPGMLTIGCGVCPGATVGTFSVTYSTKRESVTSPRRFFASPSPLIPRNTW